MKFHKWYNWKKIVKLTKLVVFSRRGYVKRVEKLLWQNIYIKIKYYL